MPGNDQGTKPGPAGAESQWAQQLEGRIRSRTARPAVVGLGYVGLPLLAEFARAGYRAIGIDVHARKVAQLAEGRSYVADVPSETIGPAIARGQVVVTTDFDLLREADSVDICVPTPLRKSRDPDVSFIVAAADEIVPRLHPGQLVILESTTYPGTTEELVLPKLAATGLRVGEDFFLAFSPERVDPGNPRYSTRNIPKVVGGLTPTCTRLAAALFGSTVESVVTVSSTRVAETVKLLENTFRSVNIGLVNEIALLCDRMDIDVWEVIEAAATKPFGFMPFYPGPGLGGHCIPIDPFYLSWKARIAGIDARFIELAGQINGGMPAHVVGKIARALNGARKPVNGSRVLVLGVAYKADIDDLRESPALDIIRLLEEQGAIASYHDPYVAQFSFEERAYTSVPLTAEVLRGCDLVVVTAAHRGLDYELVLREAPLIVDTRNAFKGRRDAKITRI
jgi:UDP-N-acetyl-D-glucosamine dehydrogenase